MFGTSANTYTLSGVTSAASTAAQGTVVGLVTTDANGNLASDGGALAASVAALQTNSAQTDTNTADIAENREGVAMAMAMGGAFLPREGEMVRISGNWGNFAGSNAVAFSGAALVAGQSTYLTGALGVGLDDSNFGGRVGISFGW